MAEPKDTKKTPRKSPFRITKADAAVVLRGLDAVRPEVDALEPSPFVDAEGIKARFEELYKHFSGLAEK